MLATKLHFIYHGITPLTVVAILNHSVIHQRRGPYYSISCHLATLINPAMVSFKIMRFKSRELKFLISVALLCLHSTKKILKLTNNMDNLVIPSACLIYSMFQTKKKVILKAEGFTILALLGKYQALVKLCSWDIEMTL